MSEFIETVWGATVASVGVMVLVTLWFAGIYLAAHGILKLVELFHRDK